MIGKVMMAMTIKATLMMVAEKILCTCAYMAVSASTLHAIITIAPFSVIIGNLYFT